MNAILIIVSIVMIAALARGWNQVFPRRLVCPICTGVSGTLILIVGLRFAGIYTEPTLLALLAGSSAVGIAWGIDKKISLSWTSKFAVVLLGLVAAYGLVEERWILFLVAAAIIGLHLLVKLTLARASSPAEDKLSKCC